MRFHIRHLVDMTIQAMTIYTRSNSAVTRRRLKDLSEGGLCFNSNVPFSKGARVYIRIPVQEPAFEARGRVSWCRNKGRDYEVGVEFERRSIDEMLRMVGQACELKRYARLQQEQGRLLSVDQAVREWIAESKGLIVKEVA